MKNKRDYFTARAEDDTRSLFNRIAVHWNLHSDHLAVNPPQAGFVICDARFNLKQVGSGVSDIDSNEFIEGDLVVYCNDNKPADAYREVSVCRASFYYTNCQRRVRFHCGMFYTSALNNVPTVFANIVKQAVVLSRMLNSIQPSSAEPINWKKHNYCTVLSSLALQTI